MKFDATIDLGSILAAASVLGGLYLFHINNVKRIQQIEMRVNQMWSVFKRRFHISDEDDMFSE